MDLNPPQTFACNDHDSHFPVGCASVVVAEDEDQARKLLDIQLIANGLKPFELKPYTFQTITRGEAVILVNGDY